MKCVSCGRENRSGAGYCAWCGAELAEDAAPASRPHVADEEAPISVGSDSPEPQEPEPSARTPAQTPASVSDVTLVPAVDTAEDTERLEGDAATGEAIAPVAPDETSRDADVAGQPEAEAEPSDAAAPSAAPDESPASGAPEAGAPEGGAPPEGSDSQGGERTPLRLGDILFERYEIQELLQSGADHNRYRARDLKRCASCDSEANEPGDPYCRTCGASLETPVYVTITENVRHIPEQYDEHLSRGDREYFIMVEASPEAQDTASAADALTLHWGYATDKGMQREHNEDMVDVRVYSRGSGDMLGLFVVADGVGGQDSGDVASRMATEMVWQSLREGVWEPFLRGEALDEETLVSQLVAAVEGANHTVYEERVARSSEMSTTMTLALVVNDLAIVGNVGDSRTYLWNADGLRAITKDHSFVQRLVDTGQIAPDDVYAHPQRNVIYMCVGDRAEVDVDTFRRPLEPDDCLVLCSDGLWEMVRPEGLEEVLLAEPDPQRACERLVGNANLAGGEDNISVIIVQAKART